MTGRLVRVSDTATPRQVAELCAQVAHEAGSRPETRALALQALAPHWQPSLGDVPPTGAAFCAALGRWAQSITMVREPLAVGEIVQAPWRTVAYRAGDCDDLAAAAAALAMVVGLPTAIALGTPAGGFAHVVAVIGDSWMPSARGRLTHMIDFDGATVAPRDLMTAYHLIGVSAGV